MKNVCPCIDNGDKNERTTIEKRKMKKKKDDDDGGEGKMLETWFTALTFNVHIPMIHIFLISIDTGEFQKYSKKVRRQDGD
jgi:hypothetical protein